MAFQELERLIQTLTKSNTAKNVILFRHGQTIANKGGQLAGWTDSKLTVQGREQANSLFQALYRQTDQFKGIYTSDLERAKQTCHIALGFPQQIKYQENSLLREINFGLHENQYYSTLPEHYKQAIDSLEYQAPEGENWMNVQKRAHMFFQEHIRENGTYLVFTHGGLICTLTYNLSYKDCLTNCSCAALELHPQTNEPQKILWTWTYPALKDMII